MTLVENKRLWQKITFALGLGHFIFGKPAPDHYLLLAQKFNIFPFFAGDQVLYLCRFRCIAPQFLLSRKSVKQIDHRIRLPLPLIVFLSPHAVFRGSLSLPLSGLPYIIIGRLRHHPSIPHTIRLQIKWEGDRGRQRKEDRTQSKKRGHLGTSYQKTLSIFPTIHVSTPIFLEICQTKNNLQQEPWFLLQIPSPALKSCLGPSFVS